MPLEVRLAINMYMGADKPKQNAPRFVMVNTAFKLAESWVHNMTKVADNEPTQVEPVSIQNRLGLGTKVARHSKFVPSNDPIEKKLHAKLNAAKRRAVENSKEESRVLAKDVSSSDEDEDDKLESRTNAFSKKRAAHMSPVFQAKKKHK
ncbi:hypothetical protein ACFE04_016494 [Oxalis oulophora]